MGLHVLVNLLDKDSKGFVQNLSVKIHVLTCFFLPHHGVRFQKVFPSFSFDLPGTSKKNRDPGRIFVTP